MLRRCAFLTHVTRNQHYNSERPSSSYSSHGLVRNYNTNSGQESENEWERLLKPFDLEELRKCLNRRITPFQVCKLLELPLDVPTSMEIFERAGNQKGYLHSYNVYYVLIDKLGAAEQFEVIDRLLLQMKDEGVVFREPLFISIMKHYGRAGFPGQATRLLLDMKGLFDCEPTFRSYNVVLDILVAGNCAKVAPNIFYEMLHKGVSPTVYTFSIVMKALCSLNEVDSACSLLRDMTRHGCVPNSTVYQTLIHALSKISRVDEALKLLEEMFLMGCTPDVNAFNDVVQGLCKLFRVQEAAKLVDRMILRGFTPNTVTYGVLMHGLCRTGQVDKAKILLSQVPEPNVVLYNTLINGYATSGRLDEAMAILHDKMLTVGCRPDVFTYNIVINGLCKKQCLASACGLKSEMISRGCEPNEVTYTMLIDQFCKGGQMKEANYLLDEMSARGLSLNTVGYNCLISALCKDGKLGEALEMFNNMPTKDCKPDIFTFNSLIYGFCRVHQVEHALRLYRDMLLEGVIANTITYNTLIHTFLRKGEIHEALKLVNDMLFRGHGLDETTYNGLIKALCESGAIEKALGLFKEMIFGLSSGTHSNRAFTVVASNDVLLDASVTKYNPSDCQKPEVLNKKMVEGNILLCGYSFNFVVGSASIKKVSETAKSLGAIGFILVVEDLFQGANFYPVPSGIPGILISDITKSKELIDYYNKFTSRDWTGRATSFKANAKIGDGLEPILHKSAPQVALFSSRGPNVKNFRLQDADLLKPDILAPGCLIWAAWSLNGTDEPNYVGEGFAMISGTSMAAPHIAGIAALVKQKHPNWSPAAIKSALMTTSTTTDRSGKPLQAQQYIEGSETVTLTTATPFEYGSGHVDPTAALNPGLIFDAGYKDYLGFLCATPGIDIHEIRNYTNSACKYTMDHPSNLNTPSITISQLIGTQTVIRTVTNVAEEETYVISTRMAPEIAIEASPVAMTLKAGASRKFSVTLTTRSITGGYSFGEVWLKGSGGHKVRIPVVVMGQKR